MQNSIWGSLDFQRKFPGGRWLHELSRVIRSIMLRNNQASVIYIISVLMEDAPYSLYIVHSWARSTLTKHLLPLLKIKLQLPRLFFVLFCFWCYSPFSIPSTEKGTLRIPCKYLLNSSLINTEKLFLILCSISPENVKGSMFVFLSWRVAHLNKIYANKIYVLYVLLLNTIKN